MTYFKIYNESTKIHVPHSNWWSANTAGKMWKNERLKNVEE